MVVMNYMIHYIGYATHSVSWDIICSTAYAVSHWISSRRWADCLSNIEMRDKIINAGIPTTESTELH